MEVSVPVHLWFLVEVHIDASKRSVRDASERLAKELSARPGARKIKGETVRRLYRDGRDMLRSLHADDASFDLYREKVLSDIRARRAETGETADHAVRCLIDDIAAGAARAVADRPVDGEINATKRRIQELDLDLASVSDRIADLERQRDEVLMQMAASGKLN